MFDICKPSFALQDTFLEKYKSKQPDFGPLGLITYLRTYSRRIDGEDRTEEFWETVERVVNGTFSIQKNHCKQHRLPWNEKKAQRTAQKMFQLIWDFKFLPPGRGLWAMGTPQLLKNGGASLNNCFSYHTAIITRDGIKNIGDCVNTEQLLLTTGGKWVKAPIKSFGNQKLMKLTLSRQGREKIIYTTPDHEWFVNDKRRKYRDDHWTRLRTIDLREGIHRLQYVFGQGINAIPRSDYGVAHGIIFGDGTKLTNGCAIKLCGEKNIHLTKFFPFSDISKHDEEGYWYINNLPGYFKDKPSLSLERSYLYGFLSGYFAADGSCDKNGAVSITSYNKENLLFVKDICAIIGIGAYDIRHERKVSNLTNQEHDVYTINLMPETLSEDFFIMPHHRENFLTSKSSDRRRKICWIVKTVEETNRFEEVFCATVDKYHAFTLDGNILTSNCAFISTKDLNTDPIIPFLFLMDMSMLGVGVGFDTRGADKAKIFTPKGTTKFSIPDDREGWVKALDLFLNAFLIKGNPMPIFDYSMIRAAGTPIKGFGGIASGPQPLIDFFEYVEENIFRKKIGLTLSSVDIVDIMNLLGKVVVSGNSRRSAEVAIGDPEDDSFVSMKQDKAKLMNHRWASNNSVFVTKGMNYSHLSQLSASNGEPGYIWLDNIQAFGRMVDAPNWKDKNAIGCNPCLEQSLEDFELCCLVETFPSRHDSLEEYLETLKIAYLYAKTVTLVPTHWEITNAVMMRNRRIGLSQSGIIKAFKKHGRNNMLKWCDEGYKFITALDVQYSNWLCIPQSIKKTSVKPSGTVSLLPGEPPGIHYPHSEYYIRRIRLSKFSPLVAALIKAGYKVEPEIGKEDSSMVAEFPIHEEFYERGKDDATIWEQTANAVAYQRAWADNQVSVTVTFKPEEADDIPHILEMYEDQLKSISFLPLTGHGYQQAPYETITKEEYEKMKSRLTPIDLRARIESEAPTGCDGEACGI